MNRMSHDVRTPINGIMGMLDIIRKNRQDEAKVDDCLDRLFSGLQLIHIEHIVDECQQMACGKIDFIEAVVHFCPEASDG